MNMDHYISHELASISEDLKSMSISDNVRGYIEAACRQAYAIGNKDGYLECCRDRNKAERSRLERRLLAADGREC